MTTHAELLQAAAEERPDLLEKVAKTLYVLENTDPEEASVLTEKIAAITGVAKEKIAGEFVDKALVGGAGMLLAGLGAAVATDLYDAAKHGLTKTRNFRRIVETTPELQQYDQGRVKSVYNALHKFAPEFTADPVLGGAVVANLAASPVGAEHTLLLQMVRARKELQEAKHKQIDFGKSILKS